MRNEVMNEASLQYYSFIRKIEVVLLSKLILCIFIICAHEKQ